MNPTEKVILACLADLTKTLTEIGKSQAKMANFIVQHLPNLSEDDKQEMLKNAETSWLQLQQLQDLATRLKKLA